MNYIESIPNNMKKIIIYCHGFGDNKSRMYQHTKILNDNNIGIASFDFPCHGDDNTNYEDFSIELCLEYLDKTVNIINNKYNVPINIIGSSFGGYIALLYVMKHDIINKVFLKYPAVNFCECVDRKLNINSKYFDNTEYIELPSGYRIYKKSYESFKRNNIMNNYSTNSEIYIIQGTLDKTVLLDDVKRFAVDNSIKLKIVDGASHGMKDYLDLVNEEIINYFK